MQKITPHLWFDTEAKDAAQLYTSVFENSRIKNTRTIHDTPSGDADIVTVELAGIEFMLLNAGPYFKFNPSVSFYVACESAEEVDRVWEKLSPGGTVMMDLGSYPFSDRYGWTTDKYGLSWQIGHMDQPTTQKITPTFMFVGDLCGKTEEAINFYLTVFHGGKLEHVMRYEAGEEPDKPGTVKHAAFTIEGMNFAAMDSARMHEFTFNEAVSFIINCETQDEIDYYWGKLSAHPESEQCGWLKDKYNVSWQVVPTAMNTMMAEATLDQLDRVTKAFLQMKKFDLAQLEAAYKGE